MKRIELEKEEEQEIKRQKEEENREGNNKASKKDMTLTDIEKG